jgi:hypothetical protein
MAALPYQDGAYESRLMIATAAALAFCAIGLVAVTVVVVSGDRFEYRPTSDLMRSDDNLVSSFQALESLARKRDGSSTGSPEKSQAPDITSDKADPAPKSASAGNECLTLNWSHFSFDCLPANRRSVRLKSPWCTGILSHQPFHSCRPRPK